MSARMIFTKVIFAFVFWSLRMDILRGVPSGGLGVTASSINTPANFSCYQCAVTSLYEKCGPETLKPCAQTADRCVTHITRTSSSPLLIRRECGLGPCSFEEENSDATAVLGMDPNHCDVNKPDVFCLFCCRGSGCNTAGPSSPAHPPHVAISIVLAMLWKAYVS
ncbi:uncharacterized protein [Hetaerina americana]|uniref:uncharacterized protein n=1 Tax=Hetaerina americana TaxID=62018 RepID=UPI003A7F4D4B